MASILDDLTLTMGGCRLEGKRKNEDDEERKRKKKKEEEGKGHEVFVSVSNLIAPNTLF